MSALRSDPRTAHAVCSAVLHRRLAHLSPLVLGLLGPRERVTHIAQVDDLFKTDVYLITARRLLYLRDLGARGFSSANSLSAPCRVHVVEAALGATVTVTGAEGRSVTFLALEDAPLDALRALGSRPRRGAAREPAGTSGRTVPARPARAATLAPAPSPPDPADVAPHVGSLERRIYRALAWGQQISGAAQRPTGTDRIRGTAEHSALARTRHALRVLGAIDTSRGSTLTDEALVAESEAALRDAADVLRIRLS